LPSSSTDENQLWSYDPVANFFTQVPLGQEAPNQLYVRYDLGTIDSISGKWVWVTGADRRAIAAGSKLQGSRIGIPTVAPANLGLNWYRLQTDLATWQKVTDRQLPQILRWTLQGTTVVSETYPADWASLGGDLDPAPPGDSPSCVLTPASATVTVGQTLELHLAITGNAARVTINGTTTSFYTQGTSGNYAADTSMPANAPGFQTVTAVVTGADGQSGTCQANYTVLPLDPLQCKLTLDETTAQAGDYVIATLTSSGDPVIAATVDGNQILGLRSATGQGISVQMRVEVDPQLADPTTGQIVIPATVTSATATADCSAVVTVTQ
jgi:hypothetical protein